MGLVGLFYSANKFVILLGIKLLFFKITTTIIISYILLRATLFLFKKLEKKWKLSYRWEMIRVFMVFALTGSSSALIGKPLLKIIGITKDNFQPLVYWILYLLIGFLFYQILLVTFGWLFGQFKFFWNFEKKMLNRMKLGFLLNEK
ncbi:MAG: hypothetical protein HON09_01755 [Flavobacteriaceae bacterium]|nr:hypothetical protein [Flavobacteriaceae bacterium]